MRTWSAYGKEIIVDWMRSDIRAQGGPSQSIAFGIKDGMAQSYLRSGTSFTYIDHAYFKRGYHTGNFRAVRSGLHLTHLLDRPSDRLKQFGVEIEPWRKTGSEIIIIPPSEAQRAIYENETWLCSVETKLCEITDRPVRCKTGKLSSLREFCRNAWAVVTYSSVAGVEAALMGIPVFSTRDCPSHPVNAGPIERIETPDYSDARLELASSLTYATWNVNEMPSVSWVDYDYRLRASPT